MFFHQQLVEEINISRAIFQNMLHVRKKIE